MPLKPICVSCQRFFRPRKTGIYFLEGMPAGGQTNVLPGKAESEKWKPYKLWAGDLWECEGCGHAILVGFGRAPIATQHEGDFEKTVVSFGANFQVNDC